MPFLGLIPPHFRLPFLRRRMRSECYDDRLEAVTGLAAVGSDGAVALLCGAQLDPEPIVRKRAVAALDALDLSTSGRVEALSWRLKMESPSVRWSALDELARIDFAGCRAAA